MRLIAARYLPLWLAPKIYIKVSYEVHYLGVKKIMKAFLTKIIELKWCIPGYSVIFKCSWSYSLGKEHNFSSLTSKTLMNSLSLHVIHELDFRWFPFWLIQFSSCYGKLKVSAFIEKYIEKMKITFTTFSLGTTTPDALRNRAGASGKKGNLQFYTNYKIIYSLDIDLINWLTQVSSTHFLYKDIRL